MGKVGQVQRSTDDICCALRKDDMATVVAFSDGRQDVRRVVSFEVVVALDVAVAIPQRRLGESSVRAVGLESNGWTGALVLGDGLWQAGFVLLVGTPCRANAQGIEQHSCCGSLEPHCRFFGRWGLMETGARNAMVGISSSS